MSLNIKNLSTIIDTNIINIDFDSYKLVKLCGDKLNKDTLISILERFLAIDFEKYYDDIDLNLGVSYLPVQNSTLKYNNGSIVYSNCKVETKGNLPKIHCIRYVNGVRIRSFLIDSEVTNDVIGVNMTEFNSVVSNSKWGRLSLLVNEMVGFDFVLLDIKNRRLDFNLVSRSDWSEDALKFVYLLISESMLTPDDYTRVILLSNISVLNNIQISKLIHTLMSISKNEFIVYSDNIDIDLRELVVSV